MPRSPARSLFIASPPPSRSSIFDANSCKLPSSFLVLPAALLATPCDTRVPPRARSHAGTPFPPPYPPLERSIRVAFRRWDKPSPTERNYFESSPEISGIIPRIDIYLRRNRGESKRSRCITCIYTIRIDSVVICNKFILATIAHRSRRMLIFHEFANTNNGWSWDIFELIA